MKTPEIPDNMKREDWIGGVPCPKGNRVHTLNSDPTRKKYKYAGSPDSVRVVTKQ